jgi:ABC-type polysaccharide/polyol phosphate transport system ATPase subunit
MPGFGAWIRRHGARAFPIMIAVRISGIGRYFGAGLQRKGVAPGVLARNFLVLMGLNVKRQSADQIQGNINDGEHALRDISLDIERGSVVCLVGPSGSGKSTLLRVLAGVIPPTEGSAELHGVVSTLLEVGDNVDDELSALENIEHQRQLKKIPAERADVYAQQVIEFAGLAGFEKTAARTYSTGMAMRLSVALALQGNPDVLLMDDVLGVGDLAFQEQFVERLHELKAAGCTMLLALSDENLVQQLATRVVTLADGRIESDGPPKQTFIGRHSYGVADISWRVSEYLPESEAVALRNVAIRHTGEGDDASLELAFDFLPKLVPQRCRPLMDVVQNNKTVFRSAPSSYLTIDKLDSVLATVKIPVRFIPSGMCKIGIKINSFHGEMAYSCKHQNAVALEIRRSSNSTNQSMPVIPVILPWDVEAIFGEGFEHGKLSSVT